MLCLNFWCCKFNNLFSNSYSRLRLQEGYNFVNNNAGIITMAKELIMKVGGIGKNPLAWLVSRTRFMTFQNFSAKRENF